MRRWQPAAGGVRQDISIHAPRGGCDLYFAGNFNNSKKFQSTHPVGGATEGGVYTITLEAFQSTHPVGGATEGTYTGVSYEYTFQSTHPVGGATTGR